MVNLLVDCFRRTVLVLVSAIVRKLEAIDSQKSRLDFVCVVESQVFHIAAKPKGECEESPKGVTENDRCHECWNSSEESVLTRRPKSRKGSKPMQSTETCRTAEATEKQKPHLGRVRGHSTERNREQLEMRTIGRVHIGVPIG